MPFTPQNSRFRLVLAMMLLSAGCRHRAAQPVGPATQIPPADVAANPTYSNESAHIRFAYPARWETRKSEDYVFLAAAPGQPNGPSLSLDIPTLPFHLPGMIGIGLVQNGYLDDLKKQHPDLKVEPITPRTVSGVAGRRVESTWPQSGRPAAEIALLLVHADRVYILRVNGPADDLPTLRRVFDEAVNSIEWTK